MDLTGHVAASPARMKPNTAALRDGNRESTEPVSASGQAPPTA